jgi:hypothetical protein
MRCLGASDPDAAAQSDQVTSRSVHGDNCSPIGLIIVVSASTAAPVGEATRIVRFACQAEAASGRSPVYRLEPIHEGARLETVSSGAMQVKFSDSSVLTLGSNTRLRVDRFVYAQAGSGEQSLALARGVFRLVSGAIPKNSVKLTTPAVSIGIRGTILKLQVKEDGGGTVYFEHRQGFVENREGRHVPVEEGERLEFSANGGISARSKSAFDAGDHAVDQGLQAFGVIFGGPNGGSGGQAGVGTTSPVDSDASP